MTRKYALVAPPTRFSGPCPECGCQGGHLARCSHSGQVAIKALKAMRDESDKQKEDM